MAITVQNQPQAAVIGQTAYDVALAQAQEQRRQQAFREGIQQQQVDQGWAGLDQRTMEANQRAALQEQHLGYNYDAQTRQIEAQQQQQAQQFQNQLALQEQQAMLRQQQAQQQLGRATQNTGAPTTSKALQKIDDAIIKTQMDPSLRPDERTQIMARLLENKAQIQAGLQLTGGQAEQPQSVAEQFFQNIVQAPNGQWYFMQPDGKPFLLQQPEPSRAEMEQQRREDEANKRREEMFANERDLFEKRKQDELKRWADIESEYLKLVTGVGGEGPPTEDQKKALDRWYREAETAHLRRLNDLYLEGQTLSGAFPGGADPMQASQQPMQPPPEPQPAQAPQGPPQQPPGYYQGTMTPMGYMYMPAPGATPGMMQQQAAPPPAPLPPEQQEQAARDTGLDLDKMHELTPRVKELVESNDNMGLFRMIPQLENMAEELVIRVGNPGDGTQTFYLDLRPFGIDGVYEINQSDFIENIRARGN